MAEHVYFVHGVANHTRDAFDAHVYELSERMGNRWEFVPIFWGDLGGKSDNVSDSIPVVDGATSITPDLVRRFLGFGLQSSVRGVNATADLIAEGAVGDAWSKPSKVRGSSNSDDIRDAIRDEILNTHFLQYIEDPDTLIAAGQLIGEAVGASSGSDYEFRTRSASRSADGTKALVKSFLARVDHIVGASIGNALGTANQNVRRAIAEPFVNFFGDIFVYQRRQREIQNRIWEGIQAHQGDAGTQKNPINLVAHSLGGVVCFDAAIQGTLDGVVSTSHANGRGPLWIKSFVTFGSQAAFFHILDRRPPISAYNHGAPVTLPPTIGRWRNLWDSMDPLAFTAGTVFRLASNEAPVDIPVTDAFSLLLAEKGWTHSIYWKTPQLLQALTDALEETRVQY